MPTVAPQVHRTAEVDPTAELGEGVVVEQHASVGPNCVLGAGTRVRRSAIIERNVTMGRDNDVHPFATIGGDPQDLKYDADADEGTLVIGDRNTFRESVTLNRGAGEAGPTRIGSDCYLMVGAHVGHNTRAGDRVIMGNTACLAGHVVIDDGCFLSAFAGVHQFVRVGRLVIFQGGAIATMHVPPFVTTAGFNGVAALNRVGMRRAGVSREGMASVKQAFQHFYRRRAAGEATTAESLAEAESMAWAPEGREFVAFVEWATSQPAPRNRGLCRPGRGEGEIA
ncbi:MAG: acyl-ACP--UDP-N-acetylglucosamine O-acyltransferase [Phycisphaerales bacterium]